MIIDLGILLFSLNKNLLKIVQRLVDGALLCMLLVLSLLNALNCRILEVSVALLRRFFHAGRHGTSILVGLVVTSLALSEVSASFGLVIGLKALLRDHGGVFTTVKRLVDHIEDVNGRLLGLAHA